MSEYDSEPLPGYDHKKHVDELLHKQKGPPAKRWMSPELALHLYKHGENLSLTHSELMDRKAVETETLTSEQPTDFIPGLLPDPP